MWPQAVAVKPAKAGAWEADLGLDELVNSLSTDRRYSPYIRQALAALNTDAEVLRWRQAVMTDLLQNPALVESLLDLLPRFANLRQNTGMGNSRQRNLLLETSDRLAELDIYTELVSDLHALLKNVPLKSAALIDIRTNLAALLENPNFQELRQQLQELRGPLENITSLTIGINLDLELRPSSAVLLSINGYAFGEPASFLEKLIGVRMSDMDETGIAPLNHLPQDREIRFLTPLFQDLDRLMTQIAQPIARALNRYTRVSSGALANLEYEVAFFCAAARFAQNLSQRGVPFCLPEIAPVDSRITEIDGLVNVLLCVRPEQPISSDAAFNDDGRIAILTGPNSGGKTTYLRAVGLAQVMFQAGVFVPARGARISPVDRILTHFPALENRQQGRLAEEAGRLREIFQQATPNSLVLLNETFSSTASGEALYLAQDILCGLRALGVRAVYATHLVELAERIEELQKTVAGDSDFFSLVAGVQFDDSGQAAPTFEIQRGLPLGRSYAQEIARRHGISLEQILALRDDGAQAGT
jgi:DNA mismatch repair protein MutS